MAIKTMPSKINKSRWRIEEKLRSIYTPDKLRNTYLSLAHGHWLATDMESCYDFLG